MRCPATAGYLPSNARSLKKTIKRHEKTRTVNGRGYQAFNLHKNNRQTCKLVKTLLLETWGVTNGEIVPPE